MGFSVVDFDLVDFAVDLVGEHGEADVELEGFVVVVGVGDHAAADEGVQRDADAVG